MIKCIYLEISILETVYSALNICVMLLRHLPVRNYLFIICTTELTSSDISNEKTCGRRNTRNISYFKVDNGEVDWNEAWKQCNDRGYTLPVICNQHEQEALANSLKTNMGRSAVWASGKKIPFDGWRWVNEKPFISSRSKMSTFILFFSVLARFEWSTDCFK